MFTPWAAELAVIHCDGNLYPGCSCRGSHSADKGRILIRHGLKGSGWKVFKRVQGNCIGPFMENEELDPEPGTLTGKTEP